MALEANVIMWGVTMLVNAGLGVAVAYIGNTTSKLNRSEDNRRQDAILALQKLDAMRAEHDMRMRELTTHNAEILEKLVESRMRGLTHELATDVSKLRLATEVAVGRVQQLGEVVDTLRDAAPSQQQELSRSIAALSDQVSQRHTSTREFDRFCTVTNEAMRTLQKDLGEIKRNSITQDDLIDALRKASKRDA